MNGNGAVNWESPFRKLFVYYSSIKQAFSGPFRAAQGWVGIYPMPRVA